MNREQAQEILQLYRPGLDADATEFAEALELARRDASLGQWLDTHCANYQTIRDRMKRIAAPAGFKEQILAERNSQNKIVPLHRSSWRKPLLAIAAIIILLLGISTFLVQPHHSDTDSAYRNRMVSTALRLYAMDLETNDVNEVRNFLARNKAPSNYKLPQGMQQLECAGCVVLRWHEKPVSMICFRTGRPLRPGEKSDLFLFVTDRASFSKAQGPLALNQVSKAATATWVDGDKFYLLATQGDENFIRKFL